MKMRALATAGALFLSALATTNVWAQQEIIVLTPQNDSYSNTLTGNSSGAFHELWFDYGAGQFVEFEAAAAGGPISRDPVTRETIRPNPGISTRALGVDGFGVAVWGPEGLIDSGGYRTRDDAQQRTDGSLGCPGCLSWSTPGADVISPNSGRFLGKVFNYVPGRPISYTVEADGLNSRPVARGGEFTSRNQSTAGQLVGSKSGASHYYTFKHKGGTSARADDVDVDLFFTPAIASQSQADNIGIKVYRSGGQLVASARGGNFVQGGDIEPRKPSLGRRTWSGGPIIWDRGAIPGNGRQVGLEFRTTTPETLIIEVFNYNEGMPINYALLVD